MVKNSRYFFDPCSKNYRNQQNYSKRLINLCFFSTCANEYQTTHASDHWSDQSNFMNLYSIGDYLFWRFEIFISENSKLNCLKSYICNIYIYITFPSIISVPNASSPFNRNTSRTRKGIMLWLENRRSRIKSTILVLIPLWRKLMMSLLVW